MPLLNFVWFLLLTIETRKLALFTVLCEQYRVAIGRDPAYRKYLDRIGQLFFGVPPPKRQAGGGLFGNLMASMMGGGGGGRGTATGAGGGGRVANGTVAGSSRDIDDDDDNDDDDDDDMSFEDMLSSFMRPSGSSASAAPRKSGATKTLKPEDDLD